MPQNADNRVTVRLPPDLSFEINMEASRRRITIPAVIREAWELYKPSVGIDFRDGLLVWAKKQNVASPTADTENTSHPVTCGASIQSKDMLARAAAYPKEVADLLSILESGDTETVEAIQKNLKVFARIAHPTRSTRRDVDAQSNRATRRGGSDINRTADKVDAIIADAEVLERDADALIAETGSYLEAAKDDQQGDRPDREGRRRRTGSE